MKRLMVVVFAGLLAMGACSSDDGDDSADDTIDETTTTEAEAIARSPTGSEAADELCRRPTTRSPSCPRSRVIEVMADTGPVRRGPDAVRRHGRPRPARRAGRRSSKRCSTCSRSSWASPKTSIAGEPRTPSPGAPRRGPRRRHRDRGRAGQPGRRARARGLRPGVGRRRPTPPIPPTRTPRPATRRCSTPAIRWSTCSPRPLRELLVQGFNDEEANCMSPACSTTSRSRSSSPPASRATLADPDRSPPTSS